MSGRDRDACRASTFEEWDHGREESRGERGDEPHRPRKGVFRRVFGLVKFAVFATPLAVFAYGGLFADCRSRPSLAGWTGFLGASACARNEIAGSAVSMQDTFALIKRLID